MLVAWMQLVRCQPARETVLSWLTTAAIREAVRLDRQARRNAPLSKGDDLAFAFTSLTHAEAFAELELVASLPRRQRELIGLQVAGYTYVTLAEFVGDWWEVHVVPNLARHTQVSYARLLTKHPSRSGLTNPPSCWRR